MKYPLLRNGYAYTKKTAEGFLRMKRQGIPRPLFSLQDKLSKLLQGKYKEITRSLIKDIKQSLTKQGLTLDAAPEDDNLESLLKFFEEQDEHLKKENEALINRVSMNNVAENLKSEWRIGVEPSPADALYGIGGDSFRLKMDRVFKAEQEDYIKRLFKDAPDKFKGIIAGFEIDKEKFFKDNLDAVRELYLDNSIQRIQGEVDWLKRHILQRIVDYATGESPTLHLSDLVQAGYEGSTYLSRLFARDQMQRFNKACTLSTFRNAGVTKVKWVTVGDSRVRNRSYTDRHGVFHRAHTELNGQIFDVENLPPEIDDYNCRCGLVPVEWADD